MTNGEESAEYFLSPVRLRNSCWRLSLSYAVKRCCQTCIWKKQLILDVLDPLRKGVAWHLLLLHARATCNLWFSSQNQGINTKHSKDVGLLLIFFQLNKMKLVFADYLSFLSVMLDKMWTKTSKLRVCKITRLITESSQELHRHHTSIVINPESSNKDLLVSMIT